MAINTYFEDLKVGTRRSLGKHTFGRDEVLEFAGKYDPQPFHVDEAAAEASIFGGLIASGWHTCSVMMKLLVTQVLHDSSSMGSPGIDEIRWLKPVRVGDTLEVFLVIEGARASNSKPDRGLLVMCWEGFNQDGEQVVYVRSKLLMGRRPVSSPESAEPQKGA
jgi:acyl dehydratase